MKKDTQSESTPEALDQEAIDAAGQATQTEPCEAETGETVLSRDQEMEQLRAAAAESDRRALLAQAEAENFRKRMRRDFEDQLRYAALPLIVDVLKVRDNLLRALQASENAPDSSGLRDGVAMVVKLLDDTLAKHSVREIPTQGELFDPNYHEAISQMPSEHPAGTVAHVAQSGFQMHERVIRPSQVIVSTGPN
jgi:molecular chaperone GrpE